jgi:hypothetical protein
MGTAALFGSDRTYFESENRGLHNEIPEKSPHGHPGPE